MTMDILFWQNVSVKSGLRIGHLQVLVVSALS